MHTGISINLGKLWNWVLDCILLKGYHYPVFRQFPSLICVIISWILIINLSLLVCCPFMLARMWVPLLHSFSCCVLTCSSCALQEVSGPPSFSSFLCPGLSLIPSPSLSRKWVLLACSPSHFSCPDLSLPLCTPVCKCPSLAFLCLPDLDWCYQQDVSSLTCLLGLSLHILTSPLPLCPR